MCKSGDNLQESVFSFHYGCSGGQTLSHHAWLEVPYSLTHITGPKRICKIFKLLDTKRPFSPKQTPSQLFQMAPTVWGSCAVSFWLQTEELRALKETKMWYWSQFASTHILTPLIVLVVDTELNWNLFLLGILVSSRNLELYMEFENLQQRSF